MSKPSILGWLAVAISTIITSLWAFWGAFEAFHEGWYFESLIENLICTAQYLTLMLIFLALSLIPLRWPKAGSILYLAFSIGFFIWICMTRRVLTPGALIAILPMTLPPFFVGLLFWMGQPKPVSRAIKIIIFLPLFIAAAFSVEPVIRIAGRVDDGNRGMRTIEGNGVKLMWAPEGPGWRNPDPHDIVWKAQWRGPTWEEARQTCRYLKEDGKSIADTPQDIWRLPTVEEAIRSMMRHGKNCEGVWNSGSRSATYTTMPDKETPLWNPNTGIIYWWTATERDSGQAYYIDFNGRVYSRDKKSDLGSRAFRAVRDSQSR